MGGSKHLCSRGAEQRAASVAFAGRCARRTIFVAVRSDNLFHDRNGGGCTPGMPSGLMVPVVSMCALNCMQAVRGKLIISSADLPDQAQPYRGWAHEGFWQDRVRKSSSH